MHGTVVSLFGGWLRKDLLHIAAGDSGSAHTLDPQDGT